METYRTAPNAQEWRNRVQRLRELVRAGKTEVTSLDEIHGEGWFYLEISKNRYLDVQSAVGKVDVIVMMPDWSAPQRRRMSLDDFLGDENQAWLRRILWPAQ